MRSDNDNRVLLFIEQDRLYTSRYFTYLRTIFEIVSKTNCTRKSTKEKQRVGVVLLLAKVKVTLEIDKFTYS
jgi:hypothetical protein